MLESLLGSLVQQSSGQAVINNPAIPNEQNDNVMQTVAGSLMNTLGQQAQGGGLGSLLSMVMGGGGNVANHQVTADAQSNVQQDLMSKLGISPQVATMIASTVVPMVLSKLMNKTADPNDNSIDAGSLMGMLGGGNQGGGLGGMLGGMLGNVLGGR